MSVTQWAFDKYLLNLGVNKWKSTKILTIRLKVRIREILVALMKSHRRDQENEIEKKERSYWQRKKLIIFLILLLEDMRLWWQTSESKNLFKELKIHFTGTLSQLENPMGRKKMKSLYFFLNISLVIPAQSGALVLLTFAHDYVDDRPHWKAIAWEKDSPLWHTEDMGTCQQELWWHKEIWCLRGETDSMTRDCPHREQDPSAYPHPRPGSPLPKCLTFGRLQKYLWHLFPRQRCEVQYLLLSTVLNLN